jgi:aspartate carbamoyltransferase catalytic subunit
MAMSYLGGTVPFSTVNAREFSSAKKGETLADTIKVIGSFRPDVIVIRYDRELGAKLAAEVSRVPILNAGDREPGQHPTQALLDWRTIRKHRGAIDGLRIAMVGDLKNGRTVRSLSYLLGKFDGVKIDFVSSDAAKMGDDVKDYLYRHRVEFSEISGLREVAGVVDVVYQTRNQVECGAVADSSDSDRNITKEVAGMMRKDAIIMHPLPRGDEIATEVDDDPRAVYLTEQIDSGLFTRMALLKMILAPSV